MIKTLPGTVIEADMNRPSAADALLSPLFLTGGLMLSQVSQLTGLEPYVIQNWVKRGFVSPPDKKKYSRRQFSRILIINMLKDSLQLDTICRLLSYINGHLDDESDDIIDDARLYLYIVRLSALLCERRTAGDVEIRSWCEEVLADYSEPYPGAKERVCRGLHVILTAYGASLLRQQALVLLSGLDE